MTQGGAIFAFTLKNKKGEAESWHIDLRTTGQVAKGEAPAGKKADGKSLPPFLFAFPDSNSGETAPGHLNRTSPLERRGADVDYLVTLILADEEFGRLFSGKAKAMQLFMSGKLKIKGDVTKATRMEPILKQAQTTVKL